MKEHMFSSWAVNQGKYGRSRTTLVLPPAPRKAGARARRGPFCIAIALRSSQKPWPAVADLAIVRDKEAL